MAAASPPFAIHHPKSGERRRTRCPLRFGRLLHAMMERIRAQCAVGRSSAAEALADRLAAGGITDPGAAACPGVPWVKNGLAATEAWSDPQK
jgi:hypothetical protein